MRWLAWAHPAWMLASLLLALLALRSGLALRRARRMRQRRGPDALPRHVRLAKPAVAAIVLGFLGGPLSMVLLRERDPFETVHAWLGTLAVVLFGATGWLGRRLEQRRSRSLDAHALLAVLSLLAGGVAALAGFVLLP